MIDILDITTFEHFIHTIKTDQETKTSDSAKTHTDPHNDPQDKLPPRIFTIKQQVKMA